MQQKIRFHTCDSFINTSGVNGMNHQINNYLTAQRPQCPERLEERVEGGGTGIRGSW